MTSMEEENTMSTITKSTLFNSNLFISFLHTTRVEKENEDDNERVADK